MSYSVLAKKRIGGSDFMNSNVDLHVHTTASDGSLDPTDVVRIAAEKKLSAVAITDHDTTDGIVEALAAGGRFGIEVIPGIELSTYIDGIGSLHLLGLWIDKDNNDMQKLLIGLREGRLVRNQNILQALSGLGIPVDHEAVMRYAGGKVVSRLHIASAMIDRGYISSHKEAFDRYLGYGKPAYFGRKRLDPVDAIGLVRNAGGVAVLAHPGILKIERDRLEAEIRRLASLGLGGVEAIHTDHKPEDVVFLKRCAADLGLAVSGGSDFHGDSKPGVAIGSQSVSHQLLAALRSRCRSDQGSA